MEPAGISTLGDRQMVCKQYMDAAAVQQDVIAGHPRAIGLRGPHIGSRVLRLNDDTGTWRVHGVTVDAYRAGSVGSRPAARMP